MATIIDFSPTALEINQVAEAAGVIKPNIAAPPVPYASPNADPNSDKAYAGNFISQSPDVLFVAEYAPNNVALGALVVWEQFYSATHYEVYRRDHLAQDDSWQRVLLIDKNHLDYETKTYSSYISDKLKLTVSSPYFAILDTDAGTNKISEYKVVATFYPSSVQVDYQKALLSKGLLKPVDISNSTADIFDFAKQTIGSEDYAWIISMLNPGATIFGKLDVHLPLNKRLKSNMAYVPKDVNIIPKVIQESAYFFQLKPTLKYIFSIVGPYTADPQFFDDVLSSVNEGTKTLSYTMLQSLLKLHNKNYAAGVGKDGFTVPDYKDQTGFGTVLGLTVMFLRLNTFFLTALYTDSSFRDILNGTGSFGNFPVGTPKPITTRPLPVPTGVGPGKSNNGFGGQGAL